MQDAITVTQLNLYVKNIMENDFVLSSVWVKGEISNFKLHTSGHMYLMLKDEGGVLRSVMFRGSAQKLAFMPENGMKVMAHGRISVYERDGQYQLYIDRMDPDGVGALYVAYEQLKASLEKEGLFDECYKKPIPKYPSKIAVITSPTGAAVRDIINVITRRYPNCSVTVYPVLVQGEGASSQIARAIKYVNEQTECDVIIAGRGGGSIEDLWAFNEEETARAIFASRIPVISAVGHETDFTIADFVADLRAPTPSAAAELAVPSAAEIKARLNDLSARLDFCMNKYLENQRSRVEFYKSKISVPNIIYSYNQKRLYIDSLTKHMENAAKIKTAACREKLSENAAKLHALSPLAILSRGYLTAQNSEGNIITKKADVSVGDEIDVRLSDGQLKAEVKEIM